MRTHIDKLRENHEQFMASQNLPRIEIAVETMSLIPMALLYMDGLESQMKELESELEVYRERERLEWERSRND